MSRAAETQGPLFDSRLATNMRRLIGAQSVNAWCERFKLPQSTINKICRGTRDATVSVLETIEERTGYACWQLLHPDFDPRVSPPTADPRSMRVASIFASIQDDRDKLRAEAIMEQFAPTEPAPGVASTTALPRQQT